MPMTTSQQDAVRARGNVIVVAGAGTGKTRTLVERCLDVIRQGASLDRVLMVTFTEAAAAEMRHRLRVELQQLADQPEPPGDAARIAEQLALVETAKISTIHSFCLRLVQSHFHELGLDPEVKVLDDQQCRVLTQETLDELFQDCLGGKLDISDAVQALVAAYAPDRDELIRALVLKLHRYTQSLPDPARWIERHERSLAQTSTGAWGGQLVEAFQTWRAEWQSALELESGFGVFDDCLKALAAAGDSPDRVSIRGAAEGVLAAEQGDWKKQKTKRRKPFSKFFDEAAFLASVSAEGALEADWQAVRGHLGALLALTAEFTNRFMAAKRELGGVDFPDLEQLALRLLRKEDGAASDVAREWQARMDYVFVDECQDINGAQDSILSAVGREGADANRFLVGDVKQSIYRFRLADPQIFRDYEAKWGAGWGQRIPLLENFRSRPGLLAFVNTLFGSLMRENVGGVAYEPLQAGEGSPMATLGSGPCVEFHLIRKASRDDPGPEGDGNSNTTNELVDLSAAEREARLVALRLRSLKQSSLVIWDKEQKCARPVDWRDMAILMRSPGPKTEVFAKVFHECGIPLDAARAGFLEAIEVSDLVSLLQLLDNPLQDIPLLAVLRSPLVGLTLDELAAIRTHNNHRPFWVALRAFAKGGESPRATGCDAFHGVPADVVQRASGVPLEDQTHETATIGAAAGLVEASPSKCSDLPRTDSGRRVHERVSEFLAHVERWRELVRQMGPSLCLEQVLLDTGYDVLLGANARGAQQLANVRQLLDLARQFDPYLRQGLHRFLRFLKALDEADETLEPAPAPVRDAVRLMSIHKSKGLEFPVVALAGLGTRFNFSDLRELILLDEQLGLTAKAMTPDGTGRYSTLPYWMAERRQRTQTLGEELRLLYVAMTRARDRLICSGMLPRQDQERWCSQPKATLSDRSLLSAQQPVDWLLGWLPGVTQADQWTDDAQGASELMTWELWDPLDERLRSPGAPAAPGVPPEGGTTIDPATVAAVASRVSGSYPHVAASQEPAKSSISALRRRAAAFTDEDAAPRFPAPRAGRREPGELSAAERGTLHHRFQQWVDLRQPADEASLTSQLTALVQRGRFTSVEASVLDLKALVAFWQSDVGTCIRREAGTVRRELPFTARIEAAEAAHILGNAPDPSLAGEFIVIQGVADLAVVNPQEIWLLDFKTDRVRGGKLEDRVASYRPQLQLYALALERIYQRPVTRRWLHFLDSGQTIEVAPQTAPPPTPER
jgi:ATP-dependent helicase/nuclease subunit A